MLSVEMAKLLFVSVLPFWTMSGTADLVATPKVFVSGRVGYTYTNYRTDNVRSTPLFTFPVTNIGLRPTFETNTTLARVETHLLDTDEDLYGMELKVEFIKFLRPEQRFPSARALLDQIQLDIQNAREVLPYVP